MYRKVNKLYDVGKIIMTHVTFLTYVRSILEALLNPRTVDVALISAAPGNLSPLNEDFSSQASDWIRNFREFQGNWIVISILKIKPVCTDREPE